MPRERDVWRIDRAGSLNRLTRRIETLPDLAPGHARIAVQAVGLNFADVFACLGLYSATPKSSFIPGLEFAGIVDAIAPVPPSNGAPHGLRADDAVMGMTRFGAYATVVDADVRYLRLIRPGWSAAEAASLPVQGLTAWYGLAYLGAIARDHVVLVQSAAGGVGLQALAIADAVGARTVAVVGREEKRQWLMAQRGLPASRIVVRDRRMFGADLDRALAALDARGFDLVFDAVSGPFFRPAFDRLRPEGRHVLYGAADLMPRGDRVSWPRLAAQYLRRPRLDPLTMVSDNRSVMGFNLIWLWDRLERFAAAADALDTLVTHPPFVGRRFPFGEAPAALRHLQSGNSIGKIVLDVA